MGFFVSLNQLPPSPLEGEGRGEGYIFEDLEPSVDLKYIQELLAHASSKTTEIYTYVRTKSIGKIKSPLDNLNLKGGGDA